MPKIYDCDRNLKQIFIAEAQLIQAEWRIYESVNQPSLFQIVAFRLDGAKPLSEPMLGYY